MKRRRLQKLQKEREEEKTRFEQPAFTGLDDVPGPSSQQVPKPVVSVRRRLDFSQILTQTSSPDDSSDESIDNPFASDSSSSESEEHEKKFAELMPVRTPSTKGMSPGTNGSQCLANEISSSVPSSYVTGLDLSVLQELAEFVPTPLSPLPETPSRVLSSSASDLAREDPDINPLPPLPPQSPVPSQERIVEDPENNPLLPPSASAATQSAATNDNRKQKAKHPILSACTCKDRCYEKIDQNRRENLHNEYWDNSYNDRKGWIFNNSSIISSKTPAPNRKRREYFFTNKNGHRIKVCAAFFLRTLGYSSNSVIKCLEKSSPAENIFVRPDQRGKHKPAHAYPNDVLETINEHIESFHPTCSHYRRSDAPLKRYLPPDVTVRNMHSLFLENHPNLQVGYDSYRKRVVAKGISFAKLGVEECEQCMAFKLHEHSQPQENPDCDSCKIQLEHKRNYVSGRIHYKKDAEEDPDEGTTIYVAADMQKVIMLPPMPGVKSCVFVNRLVAYHETFAPLGDQYKKKHAKQVTSILWHEGISGRSAADVTSAFIKAISMMAEDAKDIVIWCDNCSAQNKNWTLFTSITRYINSNAGVLPKTVTFKYLETGHTFLSADSFHGLVENNMRRRKNVYNFHDFVTVVQTCGGAPKTVEMQYHDFVEWDKRVSGGKTVKIPYLKQIQEAQFRAGSKNLFFKLLHDDDVFEECDFLMKKTQRDIDSGSNIPQIRSRPRGIPEWKKMKIIESLQRLMPEPKRAFWNTIQTDNQVADLTEIDITENFE